MARSGWRVCSTPTCPTMVEGGTRCPVCVAAAEERRGNATQRGYDSQHKATRARLLAALARAERAHKPAPPCPRCGLGMTTDQELQAGHTLDRALHPGSKADRLEHATCNLSAGGRLGAAITNSGRTA
jgi:hypothetical protein